MLVRDNKILDTQEELHLKGPGKERVEEFARCEDWPRMPEFFFVADVLFSGRNNV